MRPLRDVYGALTPRASHLLRYAVFLGGYPFVTVEHVVAAGLQLGFAVPQRRVFSRKLPHALRHPPRDEYHDWWLVEGMYMDLRFPACDGRAERALRLAYLIANARSRPPRIGPTDVLLSMCRAMQLAYRELAIWRISDLLLPNPEPDDFGEYDLTDRIIDLWLSARHLRGDAQAAILDRIETLRRHLG